MNNEEGNELSERDKEDIEKFGVEITDEFRQGKEIAKAIGLESPELIPIPTSAVKVPTEEEMREKDIQDCLKFNQSVNGATMAFERISGTPPGESSIKDSIDDMEDITTKQLSTLKYFGIPTKNIGIEAKSEASGEASSSNDGEKVNDKTEESGMLNEADCMFCSLKHVSTAYALWNEFQTNQAYQLEFVMALGELRAAELHLVSKHPDECYLVRELRLAIEQGAHAFDAFRKVLMVIAEKAEIFA